MKGLLKRSFVATLAAGALVGGLVVGVAPATTAGAASQTSATFAEPPNATPNFILPYYPAQLCSVNNISQFQWLMYRPLYWPGTGNGTTINNSLSLAGTPTFSSGGTTVTINLKNYKWANGEQVTGKDVQFFMNVYHAEKANFCGYVSTFMPDNVTNVTNNGNTVTFTFDKAYNQHWITYNELAQITPMPMAWDVTAASAGAGSGGCAVAAYGAASDGPCTKVYTFLANAAGFNPNNPSAANNSLSTYATNPLWQVVDGPWKLSAFNPDGQATFVPNSSYSGPVKPTLKSFTELPYTTDSAEFNALVGGNVTVGYVPTQDISKGTTNYNSVGPNSPRLASSFKLSPWYLFSINYFPMNFSSNANNGVTAKLFSQLYIRQAMQELINQPLYITHLFKGYATPTYGPVPVVPSNPYASALEKTNPYPYNPSRAKALLQSHGWKIVPNGTDTCTKPGTAGNQCGAGIAAGTPLTFQEQYATGVQSTTQEAIAEKASWSSVGINVQLAGATFNTVIGNAIACPKGCSWQMQNWAGGWTFAPDYYPSGEELFLLGSAANYGDYNDANNASLINQTINTNAPLTSWENYLAKQLPVFFQPNLAYQLTEVNKNLSGAAPQNAFAAILPENWRWK